MAALKVVRFIDLFETQIKEFIKGYKKRNERCLQMVGFDGRTVIIELSQLTVRNFKLKMLP